MKKSILTMVTMVFLTIFISFILFPGCDSNQAHFLTTDSAISENMTEESNEDFDSFETFDSFEDEDSDQIEDVNLDEDEVSDNDVVLDEENVPDQTEVPDDDVFIMPNDCISHYDCNLGYDENNYCRGSDCVDDSTFVWRISVALKQVFTMECVLNKGCELVAKCNSDDKRIDAPEYYGNVSVEILCSNPSSVYVAMYAVESAGTGGMMVLHDTVHVFAPDPVTLTQEQFTMNYEYGVFAYTLEFSLQK